MARGPKKRGFGRTRQLPSGRWQAFYTDPDGRTAVSKTGNVTPVRHTAPQTFDTREDAEAWLTDERRLISAGTWSSPAERQALKTKGVLTFGEYAPAWLAGRKIKGRPLADRTRTGYRDLLEAHILPTFEDVPLTSITPEMVDRWYELCAVGRPTTQARAYSLLRTILGTAVDRGLIKTANPAKVRGGGTAKRAKRVKPASVSELAIIVSAMPERQRLMVQLAAWCGLRFGELAELRRKDVDMKAKIIKVRRGVVRFTEKNEDGERYTVVKSKDPKTEAGDREVPIPPHVIADMRAHLLAHAAPGRDGLLFPSRDGEQLAPSTFYGDAPVIDKRTGKVKRKGHGWYAARHAAGRKDLRFHDLRHTGLTNAAVAGATLAELMALAGHSTPGAAMRYQHAAQDRMQELAKKLSEMAEGGS